MTYIRDDAHFLNDSDSDSNKINQSINWEKFDRIKETRN